MLDVEGLVPDDGVSAGATTPVMRPDGTVVRECGVWWEVPAWCHGDLAVGIWLRSTAVDCLHRYVRGRGWREVGTTRTHLCEQLGMGYVGGVAPYAVVAEVSVIDPRPRMRLRAWCNARMFSPAEQRPGWLALTRRGR